MPDILIRLQHKDCEGCEWISVETIELGTRDRLEHQLVDLARTRYAAVHVALDQTDLTIIPEDYSIHWFGIMPHSQTPLRQLTDEQVTRQLMAIERRNFVDLIHFRFSCIKLDDDQSDGVAVKLPIKRRFRTSSAMPKSTQSQLGTPIARPDEATPADLPSFLRCLKSHRSADPLWNLDHLQNVVEPMDISGMFKKWEDDEYDTMEAVVNDAKQMFRNCHGGVYGDSLGDTIVVRAATRLEAWMWKLIRSNPEWSRLASGEALA